MPDSRVHFEFIELQVVTTVKDQLKNSSSLHRHQSHCNIQTSHISDRPNPCDAFQTCITGATTFKLWEPNHSYPLESFCNGKSMLLPPEQLSQQTHPTCFIVWNVCDVGSLGISVKEAVDLVSFTPIAYAIDVHKPAFLQSNNEATSNQINAFRLKRFQMHKDFFIINVPGIIKTELARRPFETEWKVRELQRLYQ